MNRLYRILFLFLSFTMFFNACQTKTTETKENIKKERTKAITKTEAISIAEKFIAYQGYTDQPTNLTMETAQKEEDEFASSIKGLLQLRHNVLQKKAVEARLFKKRTQWAVGFDFVNAEENIGRCVIMDTLGNNITMKPGQLRMDWLYQEPDPKEKKRGE